MTVFDLCHFLRSKDFCDVMVLNIGEGRHTGSDDSLPTKGPLDYLWKVIRFAQHGYIIHLETNGHNLKSWLSALVCSVAGLLNGRRTVIAFGSGNLPEYLQQVGGMPRLGVRVVLKSAGVIICRNQRMLQALRACGGEKTRIELVPGFMGLSGRQFGPLPKTVDEICRTHEPVLGATVNLSPEYGVPLALNAIKQMRERYPNLGLILIGIWPEAEDQLPELRPVRDHVLLAGALAPDVTLSVMNRLSVFLRPTYFDGDSVSVREALALGIPVVASETGMRPDGVRLFKVGDCEDLCRQLELVLNQLQPRRLADQTGNLADGSAPQILGLYRQLLRNET
jgi:glycosyltransferase involved in cell wall biosynthesis